MRARRPRRDPSRVGSAIGRVLRELGHDLEAPALVLARGWEEAVGPEIAAHCEPVDWRGATLEVAVSSPAWGQHLRLRQGEVLAALRELLGDDAPTALRCRVR